MKKAAVLAVTAMALLALVFAPAALAAEATVDRGAHRHPTANAAEATVGVDFNSAYVFRGATLNDGAVAQPYIEVSGLPIDIGVWGNLDIDDYDNKLESGQFSEVDIYGSYTLPIEGMDVSVGYTEYTYPGTGGAMLDESGTNAVSTRGIADREVSLSLGLGDVPLAPSVGLYYGLDGAPEEQFYADLSVGHDFELADGVTLSLGALVSYISQGEANDAKEADEQADDGFNHYELSASLSYSFVSLGVTYIGEIDEDVLEVDEDFVFTVGLSHSF